MNGARAARALSRLGGVLALTAVALAAGPLLLGQPPAAPTAAQAAAMLTLVDGSGALWALPEGGVPRLVRSDIGRGAAVRYLA